MRNPREVPKLLLALSIYIRSHCSARTYSQMAIILIEGNKVHRHSVPQCLFSCVGFWHQRWSHTHRIYRKPSVYCQSVNQSALCSLPALCLVPENKSGGVSAAAKKACDIGTRLKSKAGKGAGGACGGTASDRVLSSPIFPHCCHEPPINAVGRVYLRVNGPWYLS
jgi:hypothetical protein